MQYCKYFLIVSIFYLKLISQLFPATPVNATEYLQQFGSLEDGAGTSEGTNNEDAPISIVSEVSPLKKFQQFFELRETGIKDEKTGNLMNQPRGGNKDIIEHSNTRRKRYALIGSKWNVPILTYRITKYPSSLDRDEVDREIEKAFMMWRNVTTIEFRKKTTGQAHINIRFERGRHGDAYNFDGQNHMIAHSFSPRSGGDIHFDDDENWTVHGTTGQNLLRAAAHEIGHSLGVSDSDEIDAIMFPISGEYNPSLKLHIDDIMAIQALYGSRDIPLPTTVPPPWIDDIDDIDEIEEIEILMDDDLCGDSSFDTVTQTQNGNIYVFRGDLYWKITPTGIADGFPRKIADDWHGLEDNLDASFTWPGGETFFFKGYLYWRFVNKQMDAGYPKLISEGFEGIPDNLDAAVVWSGNGKTYFFKGDKYWRYDDQIAPPVSRTYPQPIGRWRGLPSNIDAAIQVNQQTYFFQGDLCYHFDDRNYEADPPEFTAEYLSCELIS